MTYKIVVVQNEGPPRSLPWQWYIELDPQAGVPVRAMLDAGEARTELEAVLGATASLADMAKSGDLELTGTGTPAVPPGDGS